MGTLRLGCSAAIFDQSRQRILLMQRDDNQLWCLPSGGMDAGESVTEAVEREVAEETQLVVAATRLIGIYSDPNVLVEFPDGNNAHIVSLCFEAAVRAGAIGATTEALSVGFYSQSEIASMPIMENHVQRISDAFAFAGNPFIR